MEALLNASVPLDIKLLDHAVAATLDPTSPERAAADAVLTRLKADPNAWSRVDAMLEGSASVPTRYFALSILEDTIRYRWKTLPPEQRQGVRDYIIKKIVSLSSDEAVFRRDQVFVRKLDLILIEVVKQEWPHNWPTFISDLVQSCSQSPPSVVENNMLILKLLSEEIFDFSKHQMTSAKVKLMKESLNSDFHQIFKLCDLILQVGGAPSLMIATLQALQRYLSWIPVGFIFETKLLQNLIKKAYLSPPFHSFTVECLAEIAGLVDAKYDAVFLRMYLAFMTELVALIPPDTNLADAYARSSAEDQAFMQRLTLFFTAFFKAHLELLEKSVKEGALPPGALLSGMGYLVQLTDADETEVFKIALEFWLHFSNQLFSSERSFLAATPTPLLALPSTAPPPTAGRTELYRSILHQLRNVLIRHTPRPEEVLIEAEESGEVKRITTKDTDAIAMYKTMKDTLVYLTHLDPADTETIMLGRLARQVEGKEFGWDNLNTLCWAMGAISGTMAEDNEKRFLVTVIKDLLVLCEMKTGKDNKAVIASNIMYVVGQYPRFLRAHWKFLKTVVNKLFEFMHERHPGVQDMACDTFLKIAQRCKAKFVAIQPSETQSFLKNLCGSLHYVIADLQPHQVHTFYEAAACMVSAESNQTEQAALVELLMTLPNRAWFGVMQAAAEDIEHLKRPEVIREISRILRTNERVCKQVGPGFAPQIARIFLEMLNVYKAFSGFISSTIAVGGEAATRTSVIKLMQGAKKEVLCLIETFIMKSNQPKFVAENFVVHLLEPILDDYARIIPAARNKEVLSMMAAAVNKLKDSMGTHVARIMSTLFGSTLDMVKANFTDYPEIRLLFYKLMRALVRHTFGPLFALPPEVQKGIVDSFLWAIKHPQRDIADLGLSSLKSLLEQVSATPSAAQAFYQAYLTSILTDILYVLTDRMHKSAFKLHCVMLRSICRLVESGLVTVPLFDAATAGPDMNNQRYLREFIGNLMIRTFPHLSHAQVIAFVVGLFDESKDVQAYKTHLRDFLISLKEFSAEDNAELYADDKAAAQAEAERLERERRRAVPGLLAPAQLEDDMADL